MLNIQHQWDIITRINDNTSVFIVYAAKSNKHFVISKCKKCPKLATVPNQCHPCSCIKSKAVTKFQEPSINSSLSCNVLYICIGQSWIFVKLVVLGKAKFKDIH